MTTPMQNVPQPDDVDDGDLVNHVPDELCVVVQAPSTADPARLYEEVRGALNQHLRAQVSGGGRARLAGPLGSDLEPVQLARSFGRDDRAELLRPLGRRGISVDRADTRRPWVTLPGQTASDTAWHFYYQVGSSRVSFGRDQADERRNRLARIRELSNLLNLPAVGLAGAVHGGARRWSVSAGTPNWLTAAAPFSCGSPAALPLPETRSGRWRVRFGKGAAAALDERPTGRRPQVVVAILDTCPDPASLDAHGNRELERLLARLNIAGDAVPGLERDYFAPPDEVPVYWNACLPWWQERMPDATEDDGFSIPDHGLFVAGLVNDVAPDVELHLIRVLNDRGVGDLLALEHVLRTLPERLLAGHRSRRLIVNLSLGTAVPVPRQRHWAQWLPAARRSARGRWPDQVSLQMLDAAHQGLWNTVRWLHARGVLVVAAAGNDALRGHLNGEVPPPRYPAYYQPVLAVAASQLDGKPAAYSNRADVAPLGNGVTTFGGRVDLPASADAPPVTDGDDGRDGRPQSIVGLYSSPTLPGGEANTTGWVRWAGTSFATAIVSGFAARLWQQDASLTPADLIERVRGLAHDVSSRRPAGLDPDGPLDAPYLEAWQEFEA